MSIENRNVSTEYNAWGLITPYIRMSTHLGYCLAVATSDRDWLNRKADIESDLAAAIDHLNRAESPEAYVSRTVIDQLESCKDDLILLRDGGLDEASALSDLQNCAHNIAYAIALMERDLMGLSAYSGTEL